MTAEELFVWKELLPTHAAAEEYSASPMPLRVLEVFSTAKRLGQFQEFEVWSQRGQEQKDPLLVGVTIPDADRKWDKKYHALARWGEVLENWTALVKRAVQKRREKIMAALQQAQAQIATDLVIAKAMTQEAIVEKGDRTPHYYW